MFGLRIALAGEGEAEKRVPWFALGWLVVLVLLFGWSQWGLSRKTQAMRQAKEKLVCYYLAHDYTTLPPALQPLLPKALQKHAQRVKPFVEYYHRGGMAREQAQQWLREGDWNRSTLGQQSRGNQSCLEHAATQGLLRRHPKKRLFVTMASLVPADLQRHQRELDRLGQAFFTARQQHPWYGWGMVPSDGVGVSLLTASAISPAWFTLLWQMALLWLIAGMLERAWGGPIWLAAFLLGGLIGSVLLLLFNRGSSQPLLGSSTAVATVVGMWAFATHRRPLHLWTQGPLSSLRVPVFPSWVVVVAWLALTTLDTLANGYPLASHLPAQLLCFGMGAGMMAGLLAMEWLEPLLVPVPILTTSPIQAPERSTQPRTFRRPSTTSGKSLYMKPDLKQMVKQSYQQGDYANAVAMYRELYRNGQARLGDFDELFIACEKGHLSPEPDDFLRALRAAAYARDPDKAKAYYYRCDAKRDQMPWSYREQIVLAQELKRAGLFDEALHELEAILDDGPDGPFFMDALISKIETILAQGNELETASQLVYQAGLYLEQHPKYHDAIERLRVMMAEADGSSVPEIRRIPMGLGADALHDNAPTTDRIDTSLLDDLEQFEQRLQEGETPPEGGQSWFELPTLLLRDEDNTSPPPPHAPEDDDFLLAGDDAPFAFEEEPSENPTAPDVKGVPDAARSAGQDAPWGSSWDLPPVPSELGEELRQSSSVAPQTPPPQTSPPPSRIGNETTAVPTLAALGKDGAIDPALLMDPDYHASLPTHTTDTPDPIAIPHPWTPPSPSPEPAPSYAYQEAAPEEDLSGITGFDLPLFGGEENLSSRPPHALHPPAQANSDSPSPARSPQAIVELTEFIDDEPGRS